MKLVNKLTYTLLSGMLVGVYNVCSLGFWNKCTHIFITLKVRQCSSQQLLQFKKLL